MLFFTYCSFSSYSLAKLPDQGQVLNSISWGVTPLANGRLYLAWAQPVMDLLKQRTGLRIKIGSTRNLSLFLEKVVNGDYVVANCPLHLALYLMRYHGFKPVVRLKAKAYIVLIAKEGDVGGGLTDLSHVSLALPGRISMAGFLAEDYFLFGGSEIKASYTDNHWQVIEEVLTGRVQVGAVVNILLDFLSDGTRQQINVLHQLDAQHELSNILLVSPGTDKVFIDRLQHGLVGKYPSSPIYEIEAVSITDFNKSLIRLEKYIEAIRVRMPHLH